MRITEALQRFRTQIRSRLPGAAGRRGLAMLGVAAMLGAAPIAQAQIQNGGFETGNFSSWTLRDYNRSNTTIPVTSSAQLGLTATGTVSNGGSGAGFRSAVLSSAGTAPNTNNNLKYPFSGNSSAKLGDSGGFKATSMEQVATMSLADVDPVDNKVHIRFAMAPVLNNPGHAASQQPFFFVEVINQTKGTTLFTTFNYSNQPGIPWQSVGAYQYTDWQGFDISPGNGLLDVGDQVLLKVYVSNCAAGAADHTGQVYVDVFGSRMPGLSVSATGPSTTKPGQQITYTYNYINNSGVLAVGSRVRLAAPITENGLHLAFVPGSWPPGCTGPFAGTAPRADYIDCPVGDLNDGAGGNFNVTFTVPAGAATTAPNNIVNNGDYDIRANTVSPFIGPLVKTTILPAATPTVDLGITVNNGGVSSYAVGAAITYTVTVTNNGPIDVVGAVITQTLSGVTGTASWTCAPAPASTATCGAVSGSGAISTTGNLPVAQSLVYTVTGITATAAGTSAVTVVNVAPPGGTSDSVAANNTDGVSTPVSASQNTLTVNTTGAGTGKVIATPATLACPSPGGAACSSQLLGNGQEAYLNAVADPGSVFKNWTGDCTTITGSQCYVKMGTTDLSVTAVFAKVWTVTPSIVGGTITPNSPQTVEDGQGVGFTITPGTAGQIPVITTPGGANTCPGVLSGPVSGNYAWNVSPVTEDCAFHVTFLAPDPKVEVVKSAASAGPYTTGSVVDYQFVVTNTGNVALTGIVVNDPQLDAAAVCPVTTLAAGAATTCTGSHTVTAAEVAAGYVRNSATATGTPPSGPDVTSPPSVVDTPTAQNPAMSIVKSVTSAGPYTTGSTVDYQFLVTNTGDVTLTGIVVNDTQLSAPAVCPVTTLAPGAATTCTGSHTVTAAEVAAGYVHNSATVTGQPPTPPGGPVPPPVTSPPGTTDTPTAQNPAMTVAKSVTSAGPYTTGNTVDYQFLVTNTGDVILSGIVVNDAQLSAPAVCPVTTLAPGAATTCTGSHTVTAAEVAAGYVHNSATVTGQPPTPPGGPVPPPVTSPPSAVDVATTQNPGISVLKSVTSAGPYAVGGVIAYQFVVTNTGDVTLTGIVVNDALLDAAAVCPVTTLAPGAATTCTGSHTVTAAEVSAGFVQNSATATGQPPTPPGGPVPPAVTSPPSVAVTATAQDPALEIVKSVTSAGPYTLGSVIDYQFVVTNTGDVTLSGVAVNDAKLDAMAVCPVAVLNPTDSTTCTGSHTVTAADVATGYVHNSATAMGTPPLVPGGPAPTPITSPPSEVDTALEQSPAMTLVKSASSAGPFGAGDVIPYAFVVTNTGDVNLSGLVVNDPLLDAPAACPVTTLAPGAFTTCTGGHTVTAAEVAVGYVHNSATVTGQPPTVPGNPPTPSITTPPSTVDTATAQNPSLAIVKSVTSVGTYRLGSEIAYQFVVTNTGDVNLAGIVVNDALLDAPAVCPAAALSPGASMTCTGIHTVTAADMATGYVHNSATVTGQPPAVPGGPTPPPVTSTPSTVDTPTAQYPEMRVIKSVSSPGPYAVGDLIAYRFEVTNTGSVTMTDVVVNDARLDAPATCPATTLAPGVTTICTGAYTVTAADVAAGYVQNTATVTGQPPTVPGGSTPPAVTSPPSTVTTSTAQSPGLTLVKSVTSSGPYTIGSVIAYQFEATNTGDVTLSGIVVNDAQLDAPASCAATVLAPGEATLCTGSYTVTAADVADGNVRNTATATGVPPTVPGGPAPTPITSTPSTVDAATAQNPMLTIVKSVSSAGPYTAGSVIAYQFVVRNAGDVTLSGVAVHDDLLDAPAVCPATILAPGAAMTCTGSYTVTAADVEAGNVHNVATATGTPPVVPGGPTPTPVSSEPNEVDTPIAQQPAIATAKTATLTVDNATPGKANIGDVITYAVTVTNTGDVTLNDVAVEDTMDGYAATTLACTPTTLAPGQTAACATYTHTVTAEDANRMGGSLDNKVVATGTATTGGSVSFSVTALGNAAVVVEPDPVQIRIVKSATPYDVKVGDLVRYTLAIQNTGTTPLVGGNIVDTPPAGFSYVDGSLAVDDADKAGQLTGIHPITVANIDLPAGQTAMVTYLLRVGAGVRAGIHTNSALVRDRGETVSNLATASVQLSADPMLDESLIVGTVFDDRDGDGWQDSAALGGVKVQGGFAPGAYVAGSTTVDRGNGAQPEADASAPLLHGIALGAIAGRASEADPAAKHRVVISQTLSALEFTGDFVLTSDEGVTVRMDAAGKTTVERAGQAAKGLTAAAPTVSRTVSQVAEGYRVDYVIENAGVDERGIPGVRIASVEGLLVETDQFGRYHLTGIDGGRWERGRNFILKVDPATLPPGTVFSTDNPLLRRVTPGLPVRFDFGVKLPAGLIEGGTQPVELELGEVLFDPESASLRGAYLPVIEKMAAQIREHGAGEVVIAANGEREALAFDRAKAVREALLAQLDPALAQATTVSLRTDLADPRSTLLSLGESPVLGTVLFDTGMSAIKPGFAPVIEKIAADIEKLGGGVVGVIGHADRRGADADNAALGLRRAKAVYEAIAAKLDAQARSRLRVEINDDPTAPVGLKSR